MIDRYIECNSLETFEIAKQIFDHPEMGFEEYFACEQLTNYLNKNGFKVTLGVGGLSTAFKASYKNGSERGVSIGLLCEYDALKIGHACGHHLQGPIMLLVAQAIRNCNINQPYELVIYGTPAEEGPQGKYKMLENGCFKDIDVALMTHASPYTTVDIKSLAGSVWEVEFTGVQAHESLTPELSRSATDGMILAFQGMEFLKGHVKEDVKFITTITDCNGVPSNIDPNIAKCNISMRTYHAEDILTLEKRMIDVVKGAALMTGTAVKYKKIKFVDEKLPSFSLNEIIMDNAKKLNAPSMIPYRERTGSTDFGRVTQFVPGAVSRFALVPQGVTTHSKEFLDYGKGEEAYEGMVMGAKILAHTVADLITKPELMDKVQNEFEIRKFEKKKGEGYEKEL